MYAIYGVYIYIVYIYTIYHLLQTFLKVKKKICRNGFINCEMGDSEMAIEPQCLWQYRYNLWSMIFFYNCARLDLGCRWESDIWIDAFYFLFLSQNSPLYQHLLQTGVQVENISTAINSRSCKETGENSEADSHQHLVNNIIWLIFKDS